MATRSKHPVLTALIALAGLLTVSTVAEAHKVNMFAYVEGNDIFIEGYFSDGKKAIEADVTAVDTAGNVVATGKTDGEGQLTIPIPLRTDLRLVLNAGMGHQTDYTIYADELGGQASNDSRMVGAPEQMPAADQSDIGTTEELQPMTKPSANINDFETAVERGVSRALRPVMRNISEMRNEKELGAIVGGIGYIFGVLGIYYYIKARRMSGK